MIKKNYEMQILINSNPVKEYFHNNRTYIEGRKDSIFSIKLKNNTAERVLFIPTIDGLSVIDGKNASYNSRGYIVNGYSSMIVDGWRVSDYNVAEFYFSSIDDSYRKRQKKGNNIGSIAVAIFEEQENNKQLTIDFPDMTDKRRIPTYPTYPYPDIRWHPITGGYDNSYSYQSTTANMSVSIANQSVGTGFGKTKNSEITTVDFIRKDRLPTLLEIFYNTKKQLTKIGINFSKQQAVISNSFPNEKHYCTVPNT